ncbi:uncharacterized protein aig1 isoform X2 [Polypterus senegalus]|uniref:uncharacterized protein aig1 isoform X2 n=1 Tax=Polypterus senegalus TaxID=55291 RepID=UPI001966861A|nr:uncharacterized protein aig1 isoform X2 [Polypterus senegalus]
MHLHDMPLNFIPGSMTKTSRLSRVSIHIIWDGVSGESRASAQFPCCYGNAVPSFERRQCACVLPHARVYSFICKQRSLLAASEKSKRRVYVWRGGLSFTTAQTPSNTLSVPSIQKKKKENMALIPSQVLRLAILLAYFSILCNYKAIDMPAHQTYGGSWKFLTFINLVIQAVFFGVCVLTDLSSLLTKASENQEQERQLRKLIGLRDWMMAVLAFPVGVFVVTMFWALYLYDRDLVYPRLLDNFIPQWLNHGMDVLGSPHDWRLGLSVIGAD